MRRLSQTTQFLRDVKRMKKRGKNIGKLKDVVLRLQHGLPLEPRLRDHALAGEWAPCRDCHIEPDWVLIYHVSPDELRLFRTGTHADIL
ncbi:MAG: type II toxin-antitoxin system YafQ family toxin [Kiritimatiellaeota bacterium]|nr:type II toxin-antitoxin system YafQ family toxin [Kiritimatiellota bacterium]